MLKIELGDGEGTHRFGNRNIERSEAGLVTGVARKWKKLMLKWCHLLEAKEKKI